MQQSGFEKPITESEETFSKISKNRTFLRTLLAVESSTPALPGDECLDGNGKISYNRKNKKEKAAFLPNKEFCKL